MKFLCLVLVLAVFTSAGTSCAAGFERFQIPAREGAPALQGAVWSPCAKSAETLSVGLIEIEVALACALPETPRPLIVMSHGTGGTFMGHHDTAAALADAGFLVVAIDHPGDNARDDRRQYHFETFGWRPADLRRTLDFLLTRWRGHAIVDADRIGIFGFSRGGYTALAALGAQPDFALRRDLCPAEVSLPVCDAIARGATLPTFAADTRLRAAVLVDPLNLFDADGLAAIGVPVQLWASETGGDGVTPASVEKLREDLPGDAEWHRVPGAGHFAFLAPCSRALADAIPDLCRDADGFDRVRFHESFNATIVAFFARTLSALPQP
jgi:predicted dienelactone hydrolase